MLCRHTLRRNDIRYLYTIYFILSYVKLKREIMHTNNEFLISCSNYVRKYFSMLEERSKIVIIFLSTKSFQETEISVTIFTWTDLYVSQETFEKLSKFLDGFIQRIRKICLKSFYHRAETGFPRSVDSIGKSSGWGSAGSRARDLDKDEA